MNAQPRKASAGSVRALTGRVTLGGSWWGWGHYDQIVLPEGEISLSSVAEAAPPDLRSCWPPTEETDMTSMQQSPSKVLHPSAGPALTSCLHLRVCVQAPLSAPRGDRHSPTQGETHCTFRELLGFSWCYKQSCVLQLTMEMDFKDVQEI